MYAEVDMDSTKMILQALPTYVFISAEGKILNNRAPHPSKPAFEEELREHLQLAKECL